MKRLRFGIAIMAILLGLGIFLTAGMHRICLPISQTLEQAARADSREQVAALTDDARTAWQRHRKFSAAVSDHAPMEEIDALFDELEIYLRYDDRVHYAQCCARLASQIRAIAEAQAVNWWNIF